MTAAPTRPTGRCIRGIIQEAESPSGKIRARCEIRTFMLRKTTRSATASPKPTRGSPLDIKDPVPKTVIGEPHFPFKPPSWIRLTFPGPTAAMHDPKSPSHSPGVSDNTSREVCFLKR